MRTLSKAFSPSRRSAQEVKCSPQAQHESNILLSAHQWEHGCACVSDTRAAQEIKSQCGGLSGHIVVELQDIDNRALVLMVGKGDVEVPPDPSSLSSLDVRPFLRLPCRCAPIPEAPAHSSGFRRSVLAARCADPFKLLSSLMPIVCESVKKWSHDHFDHF